MVSVIPTTLHHLAEYTNWHEWEGNFDILHEEGSFANQQDRVRRLQEIKKGKDSSFFLSIIKDNEELISLVELFIIDSDLYCPSWILKKVSNGTQYATEAGKLLINYFFSYYKNIKTIIFDLPEQRTESMKILESFGFEKSHYYYKLNYKQDWQKIITFKLTTERRNS